VAPVGRLRDVDSAVLIYEGLAPWPDQIVMVPSMVDCCVAHNLGALAAVAGGGPADREQARTLLEEVCSTAVRHGYALVGRQAKALSGVR
jgi:hypothetical protein